MGCDQALLTADTSASAFQSTQPEWAATPSSSPRRAPVVFQSTQPEWAATVLSAILLNFIKISIHAARMGCDCFIAWQVYPFAISIHAARMGCDGKYSANFITCIDFNPRSPNGLRPPSEFMSSIFSAIFQSTQPEWAATSTCNRISSLFFPISIHAARMGCDKHYAERYKTAKHFNPRSPNGLRPKIAEGLRKYNNFNPRSPNGLRPKYLEQIAEVENISIHAARMGCDAPYSFLPRYTVISIHAARMGCDHGDRAFYFKQNYFNPRSPNGLRPRHNKLKVSVLRFQSTQPEWAATHSTPIIP